MKKDETIILDVPKYAELSVDKLWAFVKQWDDLMMYFPDLEESQQPERSFILSILSTLRLEELRTLIQEARSHRSIINNSDRNQLIEMQSDIKDTIFGVLPQKSNAFRFRIFE